MMILASLHKTTVTNIIHILKLASLLLDKNAEVGREVHRAIDREKTEGGILVTVRLLYVICHLQHTPRSLSFSDSLCLYRQWIH